MLLVDIHLDLDLWWDTHNSLWTGFLVGLLRGDQLSVDVDKTDAVDWQVCLKLVFALVEVGWPRHLVCVELIADTSLC